MFSVYVSLPQGISEPPTNWCMRMSEDKYSFPHEHTYPCWWWSWFEQIDHQYCLRIISAAMEDDNVEDATLLTVRTMISPLVGSACQANVPWSSLLPTSLWPFSIRRLWLCRNEILNTALCFLNMVVVSKVTFVYAYLGKWSNFSLICFIEMSWNLQLLNGWTIPESS